MFSFLLLAEFDSSGPVDWYTEMSHFITRQKQFTSSTVLVKKAYGIVNSAKLFNKETINIKLFLNNSALNCPSAHSEYFCWINNIIISYYYSINWAFAWR